MGLCVMEGVLHEAGAGLDRGERGTVEYVHIIELWYRRSEISRGPGVLLVLHQDVGGDGARVLEPGRRGVLPAPQQLRRRIAEQSLVKLRQSRDLNLVLRRGPVTLN